MIYMLDFISSAFFCIDEDGVWFYLLDFFIQFPFDSFCRLCQRNCTASERCCSLSFAIGPLLELTWHVTNNRKKASSTGPVSPLTSTRKEIFFFLHHNLSSAVTTSQIFLLHHKHTPPAILHRQYSIWYGLSQNLINVLHKIWYCTMVCYDLYNFCKVA